MVDTREYKETLKRLAAAGSTDYINNSSMDHAAAMIEELFRNAKGTVKIFTDHLHHEVYDRSGLKTVVKDFLTEDINNKVDILMQLKENPGEDGLSNNGFIAMLREYRNQINFFKANDANLLNIKNHFMVLKTKLNNYAWRFELDINDHIATGTFNNEDNGRKLVDFFESCISNPQKVSQISDTILWANAT